MRPTPTIRCHETTPEGLPLAQPMRRPDSRPLEAPEKVPTPPGRSNPLDEVRTPVRSRLRSLLYPAAAVGILLVTGILSQNPLADALTGESVDTVRLAIPMAYLLFAPVGAVLDALSLLTDRQHVAVLLGIGVLFLGWRAARQFSRALTFRGALRELLIAVVALVSVPAFYGFGVLGVRPMAALHSHDPDLVIVDFHSHTEASHDGRSGLDIRARRGWHRGAGFDLAYVTDHSHVETALGAAAGNPDRAGGGTSILPGREVVFRDQHVLVLGTQDPTSDAQDDGPWPILIQTIPNDLSRVPTPLHANRGGVYGIELLDADPRALRQGVEERDLILNIADSLNLALIAGSNHHGWGRTAAGWTLMRIPGWQELRPEEVGRRIEAMIREGRAGTTQVIERRRLTGGTTDEPPLMAAVTLPRLGWHVLTNLTLAERLTWIVWAVAGALLRMWIVSRRTRTSHSA